MAIDLPPELLAVPQILGSLEGKQVLTDTSLQPVPPSLPSSGSGKEGIWQETQERDNTQHDETGSLVSSEATHGEHLTQAADWALSHHSAQASTRSFVSVPKN